MSTWQATTPVARANLNEWANKSTDYYIHAPNPCTFVADPIFSRRHTDVNSKLQLPAQSLHSRLYGGTCIASGSTRRLSSH